MVIKQRPSVVQGLSHLYSRLQPRQHQIAHQILREIPSSIENPNLSFSCLGWTNLACPAFSRGLVTSGWKSSVQPGLWTSGNGLMVIVFNDTSYLLRGKKNRFRVQLLVYVKPLIIWNKCMIAGVAMSPKLLWTFNIPWRHIKIPESYYPRGVHHQSSNGIQKFHQERCYAAGRVVR